MQLFDLEQGNDVLLLPSQTSYLADMESKMGELAEAKSDDVYLLDDLDKSLWDITDENFMQIHLLRFEIER